MKVISQDLKNMFCEVETDAWISTLHGSGSLHFITRWLTQGWLISQFVPSHSSSAQLFVCWYIVCSSVRQFSSSPAHSSSLTGRLTICSLTHAHAVHSTLCLHAHAHSPVLDCLLTYSCSPHFPHWVHEMRMLISEFTEAWCHVLILLHWWCLSIFLKA